jgi:hypothetical protein
MFVTFAVTAMKFVRDEWQRKIDLTADNNCLNKILNL